MKDVNVVHFKIKKPDKKRLSFVAGAGFGAANTSPENQRLTFLKTMFLTPFFGVLSQFLSQLFICLSFIFKAIVDSFI